MDILSICGLRFAYPCNLILPSPSPPQCQIYIYETQVYRKHNYDDCRWRDVTVYEPRPETILIRYRDQKERAPPPRSIHKGTISYARIRERRRDTTELYREGLFVR